MVHANWLAVVVVAGGCLVPRVARAQGSASVLVSIPRGQLVRVYTRGTILSRDFTRIRSDSLFTQSEGVVRGIPLSQVDSVYGRIADPSSMRMGGLIGAVFGGAVLSIWVMTECSCSYVNLLVVSFGAVLGAGVGVIVGGAFGRGKWQKVYP